MTYWKPKRIFALERFGGSVSEAKYVRSFEKYIPQPLSPEALEGFSKYHFRKLKVAVRSRKYREQVGTKCSSDMSRIRLYGTVNLLTGFW